MKIVGFPIDYLHHIDDTWDMTSNKTNQPKESQMATFFHGNHTDKNLTIHEGICLVEHENHAERYAGKNGHVFAIEIDFAGLNVVECEGYCHDTNDCPADDDAFRAAHAADGVDVLKYTDEDEYGQPHVCYRLISEAALNAAQQS